jgi:ADP-heptose:LPS heptosyltransferase
MPKILILKFGALGDVVMATSLVRQIQDYHKGEPIFLVTSPAYTAVFKHWDGLNILAFKRRGFMEAFRMIKWIRISEFDRVYDLQSNDRTSLICALSGIKERVGNHPRFPYTHHPPDVWAGQCHIHERMLAVLKSGGIAPYPSPPILYSDTAEKSYVSDWIGKHNITPGSFVVLHAGASHTHPEKCWPYFLELAKALKKGGYTVVWVGADAEATANRQRAEIVGVDASNAFSITELAELGRHARFAVTNDSGPMHILSASGIPVFAFFGPTNWLRSHAIGQFDNIIVPEGIEKNHYQTASLDKITVSEVLARLYQHKLLGG